MRLFVERHDTPGAFEALESQWTALAEKLFPRLPFQTWHWAETWWRHFAVDRPALKDRLRLYVVRDGRGAAKLIAPMVLTERPARGPVRARYLHFFGADPNVTEVRGPLCMPEDSRDAYEALVRTLDDEKSEWDWLEMNGVPWGSGGEAALETRGRVRWTRETPDFYLPLPETWDALKASRGRNLKESLRKCYNSLKREGLSASLKVHETPEAVGEALERFFVLHRARAEAGVAVEHRDVFDTDRARAFLLDYARGGAARGEAKVFELRIGGAVVAARVGFVLGQELYLYFTGYRSEFARFSVMTTTTAEAIQWAIYRGLKLVNFSPGRDVSKTRWSPNEILFRDALLGSGNRPSHWKEAAFMRVRDERLRKTGVVSRLLNFGARARQ
jgi:CelD/BcsL family acetyltransferase involved in cellulose biosynthesis